MNILTFSAVVFILSLCCNVQARANQNFINIQQKTGNFSGDPSSCNKTFQIQKEYLQELNDTGSFPDESEKTPMCYLKCYLEAIGVWIGGSNIDKAKAMAAYSMDNEDLMDDCLTETAAASITEDCEKAYFFSRCIMTRSIIDKISGDEDDEK